MQQGQSYLSFDERDTARSQAATQIQRRLYSVEEKRRVRILTPELKWVIFKLFCVTDKDLNFFCILRRGFKHRTSSQPANQCTDEGLK